jgi:magnesium transporter
MSEDVETPDLSSRIEAGDGLGCAEWLEKAKPLDAVYTLSHLTDDLRESLLALLSPLDAADVVDHLPDTQALDAFEHLSADVAARIIEVLPSDEQADIIGELGDEEAEAILHELDSGDAEDVRRLASYDDFVAGGLMKLEFLAFSGRSTVREVLDDLERNASDYARFQVQYTYVIDEENHLLGVVPVREMLLAPRSKTLSQIMVPEPVFVADTATLDELSATFQEKPYLGLPVLDTHGRLVGVVERSDLHLAHAEDVEEQFRQSQGIVGGEELRSMPLATRSKRRLAWLSINIALNVLAASIIALHQETLESVIALAVFLPIISDMSGCSGSQAVAVSMRELTLGVTRPRDVFVVLSKEMSLGLVNGIALGLLIALVAVAWKGNPYFGAVVGIALAVNTVVAVGTGGTIPLVLKGLDLDPALASGPVLTTVTDMCGFLLVLSLAAAAMPYLGGL